MAEENPEEVPTEDVPEETKPEEEEAEAPAPEESPKTDEPPEKPSKSDEELPPKPERPSNPCISPTPSGEELPDGEVDQIIQKTHEILKFCSTKVDDVKVECHSLAFMLLRIKESLDGYGKDYIPKLNTFLVQADKITGEYYAQMCKSLPTYGDYVKAIEADPGPTIDAGAGAVDKQRLFDMAKDVLDTYYAEALFLRTGRNVYKDVNNSMYDRIDMVNKISTPMQSWMEIQDNVASQLENIRDQTFKISAYIDFLKQGEAKTGPELDLSPLKEIPETPTAP